MLDGLRKTAPASFIEIEMNNLLDFINLNINRKQGKLRQKLSQEVTAVLWVVSNTIFQHHYFILMYENHNELGRFATIFAHFMPYHAYRLNKSYLRIRMEPS